MLYVPDGRSVRLLINATPIRSSASAARSMVVPLEDLAPIEELERLRAEFLGMVSHELRAPLTSIKGSTATVLRASRVLDPAEVRQFFRIIDTQADPPPVLADERRIVQVLNNLFSNASRHSPESSRFTSGRCETACASPSRSPTNGGACRPSRLPHLFREYADVDGGEGGMRGFGLGLAICKGLVEAHPAASGPRAPGSGTAPGSRSRCQQSRRSEGISNAVGIRPVVVSCSGS